MKICDECQKNGCESGENLCAECQKKRSESLIKLEKFEEFDMSEIDDNSYDIYIRLCKEKYELICKVRKLSQRIYEIEQNMI